MISWSRSGTKKRLLMINDGLVSWLIGDSRWWRRNRMVRRSVMLLLLLLILVVIRR